MVLPSNDGSYFPTSSLRRSHSQSNFISQSSAFFLASRISHSHQSVSESYAGFNSSTPSPRSTIHADSADLSYASTLTTKHSIVSDYGDALSPADSYDDYSMFPFAQKKLYLRSRGDSLRHSPRIGDFYTVSADYENSEEVSGKTSRPRILGHGEHAKDDTTATHRPSRQIDYLSHEWREEDIWSSWRYIVTRRGEFSNSGRLENASWRSWMKVKNSLKTVPPDSLNWLKDCDVTWLYGPLQSGLQDLHFNQTGPSSVLLSKTNLPTNLNKKPILKRSMAEAMPRRPLSMSSLLKQTTAAIEAHETSDILRPCLGRLATDYLACPLSQRRLCGECSNVAPSTGSSGMASPNSERKHVHFNEQVEQSIAVEVTGDDDDSDMDIGRYVDESDLDDGVMMKRMKPKKRQLHRRKILKSEPAEGMTIARLPSTTLKHREDTPEPQKAAIEHSRSPAVSSSSSLEILRPAKQTGELFFGEEEDDHTFYDTLLSPNSSWSSPPAKGTNGSLHRSTSSASLGEAPTSIFMPCEAGEASSTDGIFSHVIDTANTARDMAHVLRNVGL